MAANTVARSYRELESQGLVTSRVRHGTTVADQAARLTEAEIRSRLDEAAHTYAALARQLGVSDAAAADAVHAASRCAPPRADSRAATRPGSGRQPSGECLRWQAEPAGQVHAPVARIKRRTVRQVDTAADHGQAPRRDHVGQADGPNPVRPVRDILRELPQHVRRGAGQVVPLDPRPVLTDRRIRPCPVPLGERVGDLA
ncbi:hypothetical protein ACFQX7_39295 [Luedemannella flava]